MPRVVFQLDDDQQLDCDFEEPSILIGRHNDCVVQILSASVSNRHAKIEKTEDGWTFSDLGSTNGSSVNGVVAGSILLGDGDVITVGDIKGFFFDDRFIGDVGERKRVAGPPSATLEPNVSESEDFEDDDRDDEPGAPPLMICRPTMRPSTAMTVLLWAIRVVGRDTRRWKRNPRPKSGREPATMSGEPTAPQPVKPVAPIIPMGEDAPKVMSQTRRPGSGLSVQEQLDLIRRENSRITFPTIFWAILLAIALLFAGLWARHYVETDRTSFFLKF
jgi:pSer/pThr/pTyr-binding forkhead associated (FHA) protein